MQYRRKKTVNCSRPLQICSTGGRRRWLIRPNPVGWKFLGAFLKYILDTASSEDGSCLKMVEKEILCLETACWLSLVFRFWSSYCPIYYKFYLLRCHPRPVRGTQRRKYFCIFFWKLRKNFFENFKLSGFIPVYTNKF